jgi:hypothetical protein
MNKVARDAALAQFLKAEVLHARHMHDHYQRSRDEIAWAVEREIQHFQDDHPDIDFNTGTLRDAILRTAVPGNGHDGGPLLEHERTTADKNVKKAGETALFYVTPNTSVPKVRPPWPKKAGTKRAAVATTGPGLTLPTFFGWIRAVERADNELCDAIIRSVAICVAHNTDLKSNCSRISELTIARFTRHSLRRVRRSLHRLVALGWLVRRRRMDRFGKQLGYQYALNAKKAGGGDDGKGDDGK